MAEVRAPSEKFTKLCKTWERFAADFGGDFTVRPRTRIRAGFTPWEVEQVILPSEEKWSPRLERDVAMLTFHYKRFRLEICSNTVDSLNNPEAYAWAEATYNAKHDFLASLQSKSNLRPGCMLKLIDAMMTKINKHTLHYDAPAATTDMTTSHAAINKHYFIQASTYASAILDDAKVLESIAGLDGVHAVWILGRTKGAPFTSSNSVSIFGKTGVVETSPLYATKKCLERILDRMEELQLISQLS